MEQLLSPPSRAGRSGAELLNELRQPVLVGLSRALRRAFASAIDDLLERLLAERAWDQRQAIDDGLDLLRTGREGIEIRFDRACAESWVERTRIAGDPQPKAPEPKPSALSLVDDDMLGDQLLVGRIAARSRRRLDEEQVDGLRARFGALMGRDWFADNEYPIAPDHVFESLRKALAEFGQPRVVLFLLEIFEPKLSADLSTLYADVNRRLVELGVLPEIRYQIAKSAGGAAGGRGAPSQASPDPAAVPDSESIASRAQAAMLQGPMHPAGSAQAGPAQAFQARTGPVMMAAEAVADLADQLDLRIQAAQGSATRYLSDPTRFGEARPSDVHATERLIDALSTMQSNAVAGTGDIAALVSSARAQSTAVAKAHGSPLERLIIETVSLIFEQVYEDEAIADAIKQQLLRLQVAAFKAALIDPSFFARPEHPMRRFIDRLAETGSDPDFETQSGSPLATEVAELVTWILDHFERDLAIFAEALARVDTIVAAETERRRARLARIAAAAEKAEQLEATRSERRKALTETLPADTPEFVARLVADHWSEVVSRIQSGAAHAPFELSRAGRTVDTLIWSIGPKQAADIPRLAAELPQLIADLSRGLSFIALAEAERELFFSELLAWHGATIDEVKRGGRPVHPVSAAQTAAETPLRPAPQPARPPAPSEAAVAASPAGVPVLPTRPVAGFPGPVAEQATGPEVPPSGGTLVDDAVGMLGLGNGAEVEVVSATGDVKRFKLGWMSPARTVFIFSRYPRDHWTARRPVLNTLIDDGRLRVLSRGSKTTRAIESLKAR